LLGARTGGVGRLFRGIVAWGCMRSLVIFGEIGGRSKKGLAQKGNQCLWYDVRIQKALTKEVRKGDEEGGQEERGGLFDVLLQTNGCSRKQTEREG